MKFIKVQTTLVLEKGRGMLWVACFPADGAQMGRNAKAERAPPDGFLMASVVFRRAHPSGGTCSAGVVSVMKIEGEVGAILP